MITKHEVAIGPSYAGSTRLTQMDWVCNGNSLTESRLLSRISEQYRNFEHSLVEPLAETGYHFISYNSPRAVVHEDPFLFLRNVASQSLMLSAGASRTAKVQAVGTPVEVTFWPHQVESYEVTPNALIQSSDPYYLLNDLGQLQRKTSKRYIHRVFAAAQRQAKVSERSMARINRFVEDCLQHQSRAGVAASVDVLVSSLRRQAETISATVSNEGPLSICASLKDVELYIEIEPNGHSEASVVKGQEFPKAVDITTASDLMPEVIFDVLRSSSD